MAVTKISDIINPTIFNAYSFEPAVWRNRFVQSGVMVVNPAIDNMLAGGGDIFNTPSWDNLAGQESEVPADAAQTVYNITASQLKTRRQVRTMAWGSQDLAAVLAGADPLAAISSKVVGWWTGDYDKMLIASVGGVLADNIANDGGDLVNDVSGGVGVLANLTDDAIIDTQGLLGENGVIGRQDSSDYVGIAMHSAVYNYMQKLDLIDTIPTSDQTRSLQFYRGMSVIVDDRLPVTGVDPDKIYTTILFKAGAFQFGSSQVGYEPTSIERSELVGFGTETLITRRVTAFDCVGTAWSDTSVAAAAPTNAEILLAANWDRIYDQQNMRFVALKSKINQT